MPAVIQKTFQTTLVRDGAGCHIVVPFDPAPVFGKVRAPVTVALHGYRFRSTIAAMGGAVFLPLRRSHREAAGLAGDETLEVTLTLDEAPRTVAPPPDLRAALRAGGVLAAWQAMSYTHQREHVEAIEQAKKPETRARRLAAAVAMVQARTRPAGAKAGTRPARAGGSARAARGEPAARPTVAAKSRTSKK